jgi:hypothetical protein
LKTFAASDKSMKRKGKKKKRKEKVKKKKEYGRNNKMKEKGKKENLTNIQCACIKALSFRFILKIILQHNMANILCFKSVPWESLITTLNKKDYEKWRRRSQPQPQLHPNPPNPS